MSPTRLGQFQHRVPPSFPPVRRREAVRRVLADPDTRAHRLAVKVARIAAHNAKGQRAAPVRCPQLGFPPPAQPRPTFHPHRME